MDKPKKMTQKQAQFRNDKIRRLRGIAATARGMHMPPSALANILNGVDEALAALGADSEQVHRDKQLMTEAQSSN